MAFVLAHEAAHIHLGHAWDRSRANALVSLFRTANPLVGVGMRMLLDRAYSREQEFEADKLAVSLSARAEYAPDGAITLLTRLAELAGTGSGVVSQLLSTHPPVKERIGQLQDSVRQWQNHRGA
jgi:predicted Zn-dependent protease